MSRAADGRLFVVSTPIGNLDDITLRALKTLRAVDLVLAEDTRRGRVLLEHHGVQTPLRSLHAHTSAGEIAVRVAELASGKQLALISDAGTPLVSDPGAALVTQALDAGVSVEPIPGPSAVLSALVASGLGGRAFRFAGFLPRKGPRRRQELQTLVEAPEVQVFFEAPTRVGETLGELAVLAPERKAAVCRELTKLHEETVRAPLSALAERFRDGARGEITVVIDGAPPPPRWTEVQVDRRLAALRAEGRPAAQVAKQVAKESGWSRGDVFERVTKRPKQPENP